MYPRAISPWNLEEKKKKWLDCPKAGSNKIQYAKDMCTFKVIYKFNGLIYSFYHQLIVGYLLGIKLQGGGAVLRSSNLDPLKWEHRPFLLDVKELNENKDESYTTSSWHTVSIVWTSLDEWASLYKHMKEAAWNGRGLEPIESLFSCDPGICSKLQK